MDIKLYSAKLPLLSADQDNPTRKRSGFRGPRGGLPQQVRGVFGGEPHRRGSGSRRGWGPLYESNLVNQYLAEVYEEPKLLPEDPKARA